MMIKYFMKMYCNGVDDNGFYIDVANNHHNVVVVILDRIKGIETLMKMKSSLLTKSLFSLLSNRHN